MWRSELARYGMFVSYMYWFLLNSQVTIKGTVFSYNVWPKSYLIGKKNVKYGQTKRVHDSTAPLFCLFFVNVKNVALSCFFKDTEDIQNLQKAADFVRAFILGFEV